MSTNTAPASAAPAAPASLSFADKALAKLRDFKIRRFDFKNGDRVERDECEEIMMRQCESVLVKRSEWIETLKNTTWKALVPDFEADVADAGETEDKEVVVASDDKEYDAKTPLVESSEATVATVASDDVDVAQYISYRDIFNKLATLLKWDEKKKKRAQDKGKISQLVFGDRCPSTNVATEELVRLLAKRGVFGEMPADNYLPERDTKPSFLARLKCAPPRISWAQLCQLYNAEFEFSKLILKFDKKFYELQKEAFKQSKAKKADDDKLLIKQYQNTKVPVERVYKKLLLKMFAQEPVKHPFWATKIGREWAINGADALTDATKSYVVSWRKVFTGLQQIAPVVTDTSLMGDQTLADAISLYETEKSRLGAGRNSMSQLESVIGADEDESDDPTAAASYPYTSAAAMSSPDTATHGLVSPDDLIQLQMQVKSSQAQTSDLKQQLAAAIQLAQDRATQIATLQTQLVAATANNGGAVYTTEHMQQAVAQAQAQAKADAHATITSLQQQIQVATQSGSSAIAGAQSVTADHMKLAVNQAHQQSQAVIAHYQKQAETAQQQLVLAQNGAIAPNANAAVAVPSAASIVAGASASASSLFGSFQNAAGTAANSIATPAAATTTAASNTAASVLGIFGNFKKQYRAS